MLQTILQGILLFVIINLAILFGGLEGWFGWNPGHLVTFLFGFGKVFALLIIGVLIMKIFRLEEAPLLIAGLVFGILVIFGNSYYGDFQKAFYQKQSVGGALEVKSLDLGQSNNLYKTPYLKIIDSGIGGMRLFKRNVGKPDMPNVIEYCYKEILNTKQPVIIIATCSSEKKENLLTLKSLEGKKEIVAELLPKRAYFSEVKGLQLSTTQKTFEDYYKKQLNDFQWFVKIVNIIGVIFMLVFLFLRFYVKGK